MSSGLDKYEQLIAQELAGIISPENLEVLNKAKAEDPRVYELWEENQRLFSKRKVQEWMDEKTDLPPASDIPTPKQYKQVCIIATCIAIAVLSGLAFLLSVKKSAPKLDANIIQLRLENGAIIDLSQAGEIASANTVFKRQPDSLTYSSHSATSANLIVPAGKKYHITLSDGTAVTLNAASSLRFPTVFKSAREVSITGEVYFNVTKKANSPFVVKTVKGEITVLGTAFNINSYDKEKLRVSLVEGKVQYRNGSDSCLLEPGLSAIGTDNYIQVREFNAEVELGWLKGNYRFSNKTLDELLKVLARSFGQEIVLDNPAIAKESISGMFVMNKSVTFNLDQLKKNVSFEYLIDENNIIHIK